MNIILSSIPIFIIIVAGFVTGRQNWLNHSASDILAKLIFYFVMPITLFRDIARLPVQAVLVWPYMGAFCLASILIALLSLLISKYYFKQNKKNLVINTMAATHTNTAYIALPLFLLLFNTTAPVASIIVVQSLFNFTYLFFLDKFNTSYQKKSINYQAFSILFRNPILIGILVGLVFSYFHITMPNVIASTFLIIKQSAAFLALFTLGLSLSLIESKFNKDETFEIGFLVILKTIVHPMIAYITGYYIFGLTGFNLFAVIFMAAMPTAKNLFVFAKRYDTNANIASLIVLITTIISMFTLNIILLLK